MKFKDVSVCVKTEDGTLQEYGERPGFQPNSRYCYIEAQNNVSFKITLKPEIPYPFNEHGEGSSQRRKARDTPVPFHYLASLHLDGRSRPERRTIVYLDSKHPEFRQPSGQASLARTWCRGSDGTLLEKSWYFREVGIEAMLKSLQLSGGPQDAANASEAEENELLALFDRTSLTSESNVEGEDRQHVGKIEVVFHRVTLGSLKFIQDYDPKREDGEDEGISIDGKDKVSHTVT